MCCSLNLSNHVYLEELECSFNSLVDVNITQAVSLEKIIVYNNQLTSLDVSYCTNLDYLDCSDNQISNLDVTNNNNLTLLIQILMLLKNSNLVSLYADNNNLNSIDLSRTLVCKTFMARDNNFIFGSF